jgi:hypothetical protein
MTARRTAGLALAGYALVTFVAFSGAGAPGGDYEPDKLSAFLGGGHVGALLLGWLGLAAALALLLVGRNLRVEVGGGAGDLVNGLAVVGAAAGVVGWTAVSGLSIALVEGGSAVTEGLPGPVAYTMGEVANLLAVCAPAFAVGVLALVVAVRCPLPGWLRVVSVLGGLGGLTAPLFFTYFVFLVWAVALGGWLALRPGRDAAPFALEVSSSTA